MPKTTTARWRALASAVIVAGAAALVPAATVTPSWASAGHPAQPTARQAGQPQIPDYPSRAVCARVAKAGFATCLALVRTGLKGHIGLFGPDAAPTGYGPADLQSAYHLPSATAGSAVTVALVDAYDDPTAEADLQVYRKQYGLPVCDTANGCFTKVNQEGKQGSYPAGDSGWGEEESLDVDMVSAICPLCHILLVEADDDSFANLGVAEDEAVTLGAKYVSNSYASSGEAKAELGYDHFYDHPGVVITAAAGDNGYQVNFPAVSPDVTAVGGTSLVADPSVPRGWSESAWKGTGSGCSKYEAKPAWQHDPGCTMRTVADVSAVADPSTGVALYDTDQTTQGWNEVGGTSVATPIIAATYALAGTPVAGTNPASYPYAAVLSGAAGELNDVTSGANGHCAPAYLCTAGPGYDGPTGNGTPDGTAAFAYRPSGTVTGTVTDSATGKPIAGAQVSVPGFAVTTGSDGTYTLPLPAATYQLTVADYTYQTQTLSVTVTAKTTTTENVKLAATPRVTVSGTVTDGSGHGWPLYAKVTWSDGTGHGGTTFTTPASGGYQLSLLANAGYTLHVGTIYPGYEPATEKITVGSAALAENVALTVNALACDAPGYHALESGVTQPFGGIAATTGAAAGATAGAAASQSVVQSFAGPGTPKGWTVSDVNLHYPGYSYQPGWVFGDPGHRGNHTGGTGGFAIVDSDHDGPRHYQDTYLTSPVTNLSADKSPQLAFATSLVPAINSTATVQLSTDAGQTWTTVWTRSGYPGIAGPAEVAVALPRALGSRHARIRFGYTGEWSQYWEIDNVFVGNRVCAVQTGGLLTGRVAAASGAAIDGATVTSVADPGQHAVTVATPGDTAANGGLYWLFTTATGGQKFTAAGTGYTTVTNTAQITAGKVTTLNFTLPAAS
jgi:hypothetical protein